MIDETAKKTLTTSIVEQLIIPSVYNIRFFVSVYLENKSYFGKCPKLMCLFSMKRF